MIPSGRLANTIGALDLQPDAALGGCVMTEIGARAGRAEADTM